MKVNLKTKTDVNVLLKYFFSVIYFLFKEPLSHEKKKKTDA